MAEKPRRALPSLKLHESGMSMREIRARMQAGEPPATAEEYLLRVRLEADDLGTIIGHQKITVNFVFPFPHDDRCKITVLVNFVHGFF